MSARRPRVLHLQYSDPAAYPPIQHATRALTRAGFDVSLLSLHAPGESRVLAFPEIDHARVRYVGDLDRPSAATFARFLATAVAEAIVTRPRWLYVSDPTAAPAALAIHRLLGTPIVYHEHDSPGAPASTFTRLCFEARARVARIATVNVLPNAGRASELVAVTRTERLPVIVWNCPDVTEIAAPRSPSHDEKLRVVYIGSISPTRPDASWVRALAETSSSVELHVVGYETGASPRHVATLKEIAAALGVSDRLVFHGPMSRAPMMAAMARYDVGVCLVPPHATDVNLRCLVGASNKVFDTFATGAPAIVNDDAESVATFVDAGCARACSPVDATQIAAHLRWFDEHRAETRAMGERGRQRAIDVWNYGAQFQPVLDVMRAQH